MSNRKQLFLLANQPHNGLQAPLQCMLHLLHILHPLLHVLSFRLHLLHHLPPRKRQVLRNKASLTQFNLTSNNTLSYNFRVNVTVRNPNKHIMVYYRSITAIAWYKKRAFAWVSLTSFVQGHKNTSFLQPAVFEGQRVIDPKPRHVAEYNEETRAGIYNNIVVDLDLRIRAKYGRIKSARFRPPVVQCRLRVPLVSSGKSAVPFNVTKCRTGYFFADRDSTD